MGSPINLNEIEEIIKTGIRKGYREHFQMCEGYNEFTEYIREYLLTVNVAQHLNEWKWEQKLYEIKVVLEYPLKKYYENAFPPGVMTGDSIFTMGINTRKENHSPTPDNLEKIDVSIICPYHSSFSNYDQSLVGIEIKGINQQTNLIKKDISRLSLAMTNIDEIGDNSIVCGYAVFLQRLDKPREIVTDDQIEDLLSKEKAKWDKICGDFQDSHQQLSFICDEFEISSKPFDPKYRDPDDDYGTIAEETGCIYGYLIKITRK